MDEGLISSLYYYRLGIIKRENKLYCLVDLDTGEWYEKMSIHYIRKLISKWNEARKGFVNNF